jgi:hypothetical protein
VYHVCSFEFLKGRNLVHFKFVVVVVVCVCVCVFFFFFLSHVLRGILYYS